MTNTKVTNETKFQNWNYELSELLQDYGFLRIYLMDDNYIGYIHQKSGFEVEYNTLNPKTCYTIFPYGRSEYYENETKGSIKEVDTFSEVCKLLKKHKIEHPIYTK